MGVQALLDASDLLSQLLSTLCQLRTLRLKQVPVLKSMQQGSCCHPAPPHRALNTAWMQQRQLGVRVLMSAHCAPPLRLNAPSEVLVLCAHACFACACSGRSKAGELDLGMCLQDATQHLDSSGDLHRGSVLQG